MNFFSTSKAVLASIAIVAACSMSANAQSTKPTVPKNWQLLSYDKDSVYGVGAEKAYQTLLKNKKSTPVIVAVIDSGIDTTHEDLKPVLWRNPKEIPNNGIDDDKNGYIDDVFGWNFLGAKDGGSVKEDSDEASREYYRLKKKYINPDSALANNAKELAYWQSLKEKIERPASQNKVTYKTMLKVQENVRKAENILTSFLKKEDFTLNDLDSIKTSDEDVLQAQQFATRLLESTGEEDVAFSKLKEELTEYIADLKRKVNSSTQEPEDKRTKIVGDNIEDINDRYYGNNDVTGQFAFHGTHVAGIIGAARNNGIGMDGIANNVKIMAVKVVPEGDERDKDVALGIRYAVDNGAQIINMSFGKGFSPHKEWVDDALKYAESKGVLVIHAAGNDGNNNDSVPNFPSANFNDGTKATNIVTVGAMGNGKVGSPVAGFSNYGKTQVDVFAPGVQIYSTVPGAKKYDNASGTSMAAPVVAGVAALVLSYYPDLSARQLKYILEKSAVKLPAGKNMVNLPGDKDETIDFADLSTSGGVVNAYEALKLAATIKGEKKPKAKVAPVKRG
ncbi:subtilase family protein [Chitinophaga skermanii]|uniref:Subtilase family protein n=1 Tax=Chitinophaga skermanii TaxID=331697 RepID=A0A327QQS6_9BACT|nr:S8 family serine peptidase [Chitinophaga skermanii]RAJ06919.1 subtilase family protein [Chitinophaga skermanii]